MKSLFTKSNLVRGLATSTAALLVMSGAAHAALTFGSGSLTASSALILGDALTGTDTSTVAIFSSDWEIDATGAMTGIGAITSNGDVSFTGGDITGAGSEKIDISEATSNAFTFTRDDSGVVTLTSADDDANAGLTVGAGGTGALILGDVGSTSQMISSDWTIGATGDMAGIGAITTDGLITAGAALTVSVGDLLVSDGAIANAVETVASATNMAIDSSVATLTGTTTIATITGGVAGQLLTLIFTTAITVTDDDTATAANAINLAGTATNFTSAAGDTMQLVYTGAHWREISRSVNN